MEGPSGGGDVVLCHRSPLVADALARALVLSGIPARAGQLTAGPAATRVYDEVPLGDLDPGDLVLDGKGEITSQHDIAELAAVLRRMRSGQPRRPGTRADGPGAALKLTDRELEVLTLLAAGASNDSMSATLGISPNTVRTHVQNLLGKLGVDTRLAAAALARRHRLLSVPS